MQLLKQHPEIITNQIKKAPMPSKSEKNTKKNLKKKDENSFQNGALFFAPILI